MELENAHSRIDAKDLGLERRGQDRHSLPAGRKSDGSQHLSLACHRRHIHAHRTLTHIGDGRPDRPARGVPLDARVAKLELRQDDASEPLIHEGLIGGFRAGERPQLLDQILEGRVVRVPLEARDERSKAREHGLSAQVGIEHPHDPGALVLNGGFIRDASGFGDFTRGRSASARRSSV